MARIRTVKPDFFRHEALQDLELANPGMYPMMVFQALWGHCDSKGRFEWKPRMLKLDILPFLPFDMAKTLEILESAGMIHRYEVGGKQYGLIETFEKHQRLTGKESTEGEKHPEPIDFKQENEEEATGKHRGNTGEIPDAQEGKGREGKGKESAPASPEADSFPTDASLKTETPAKPKTSAVEFKTFLAACTDAGKPAIPEDDPIFAWADDAGIPLDFLGLAWAEFRRRYNGSSKRYRDWRQVFRNAVRDNWFKLWFCNENGQVCLSNQGRLIQKTHGVTA
jgi:hypothetical protein